MRENRTIRLNERTEEGAGQPPSTLHEIVTQGPKKLADLMQALRSFLGQNDMMAIRLVEMRRVPILKGN